MQIRPRGNLPAASSAIPGLYALGQPLLPTPGLTRETLQISLKLTRNQCLSGPPL